MAKGPTAPAAPAPQEASQPPRVVPKRDPRTDIGLQVAELAGWMDQLKRAHVGFNTLNLAYLTAMGQVPQGERKKGLPLLEFTGVLDGKEKPETMKCVTDMKRIPKKYLPHVFIPMISVHAGEVLEAVEEMEARIAALKPSLQSIVAQVQPQDQAEAGDDEDEEEESGDDNG